MGDMGTVLLLPNYQYLPGKARTVPVYLLTQYGIYWDLLHIGYIF